MNDNSEVLFIITVNCRLCCVQFHFLRTIAKERKVNEWCFQEVVYLFKDFKTVEILNNSTFSITPLFLFMHRTMFSKLYINFSVLISLQSWKSKGCSIVQHSCQTYHSQQENKSWRNPIVEGCTTEKFLG